MVEKYCRYGLCSTPQVRRGECECYNFNSKQETMLQDNYIMNSEYKADITMSPIQTTTITPLLWRHLTEDAKRVVTRSVPNTVHEYEVPITRYDNIGGKVRRASICSFGCVQVEMKYGERNIDLMDQTASIFLSTQLNRMVGEKLIRPVVMMEPFKMELSLISHETGGAMYSRVKEPNLFEGREWKRDVIDGSYMAAKFLRVQGEGIDSDKELIASYERTYTDEEMADCMYRVIYCLYVFPSIKFDYVAASVSPYLDEYQDKDNRRYPCYTEDYNRYLGCDLFVNEGALLPKMVITL